jgi:hypothetical protein
MLTAETFGEVTTAYLEPLHYMISMNISSYVVEALNSLKLRAQEARMPQMW